MDDNEISDNNETTMGITSQQILETISMDHQSDLFHFTELLKTKIITFEQYCELITKSQKSYNDLFEKIQIGWM